MKKRITMLLAAIGVLLVMILPVYANVIPETSESEVIESEFLPETDIETESETAESTVTDETAIETETEYTIPKDTQPVLDKLTIKNIYTNELTEIHFDGTTANFGTTIFCSKIMLCPESAGTITIDGHEVQSGDWYGPIELPIKKVSIGSWTDDESIDVTTTIQVSDHNQTTTYTLTSYRYIPAHAELEIYYAKDNGYGMELYNSAERSTDDSDFYYPEPDRCLYLTPEWLYERVGGGYEYTNSVPEILYQPIVELDHHRLYGENFVIDVKMVHNQKPEDFSVKLYYTVNGKRLDETGSYTFQYPGPAEIGSLDVPDGYTYDLKALGLGDWECGVHHRSLFYLDFDEEADTWKPSVEYCEVPVIAEDLYYNDETETSANNTKKSSDSSTSVTKSNTSEKSGRTPETDDTFPFMTYSLMLVAAISIFIVTIRRKKHI